MWSMAVCSTRVYTNVVSPSRSHNKESKQTVEVAQCNNNNTVAPTKPCACGFIALYG